MGTILPLLLFDYVLARWKVTAISK